MLNNAVRDLANRSFHVSATVQNSKMLFPEKKIRQVPILVNS